MLELIKEMNFIEACDSYKLNHYLEIADNVEEEWVVVVPRKESHFSPEIVAMGQSYVARAFAKVRITDAMIDEAEVTAAEQGYDFNRAGWEYIRDVFGGRLPLQIWGVEEGRVVSPQTPILGIRNTGGKPTRWLPGMVETLVQQTLWYMCTVASICRVGWKKFEYYIGMTGGDMNMLEFKFHNFGDRGAPGREAAVLAGIAHAALFSGSDCTQANGYIKRIYNTGKAYTSSVEATEHHTVCTNSDSARKDDFGGAVMAVERLEARAKSKVGIPVVSTVIDTYDDERFTRQYLGEQLRDRIIASGGRLVARPDTGTPHLKAVEVLGWLEEGFGVTYNDKEFKNLPPCVGMIYGDGMDVTTFEKLLKAVVEAKYSIDNLLIGMGGGITNYGGRDDFSFSMKATAMYDGRSWERMLKEPKSDLGKTSLSGLVRCREDDNGKLEVFDAIGQEYLFLEETPGWRLWFEDGRQVYRQSFDEVRERARA